ncbi:MAG: hypothetical protein V9G17_17780 [Nitrospira sp.]|jgi:hypothetical protein|nr:hypothetical protein [Nitrospira sp.]HQY57815.1 hypothetical protein [Nitrospira sp.]HRA95859.1 hypothetical protein [Nitrospira sp.]
MTEPGSSGRRKNDGGRAGKIAIRLKRSSSWTALTTLLLSVGFLIAGGVLYYTYVKGQEASLTKRHFRNLETIGRNLSEATKAYENVIGGGSEAGLSFPQLPSSLPQDQRCFSEPFVKVRGSLPAKEAATDWLRRLAPTFAYLCASSKLHDVGLSLDIQPPVAVDLRHFQKEKVNQTLKLALDEGYEFKALGRDILKLTPPPDDFERDSKAYRVTPELNGRRGLKLEKGLGKPPKWGNKKFTCSDCRLTLHARFDLQPVLDELVPPDTFADLFVADEQGNVIVHRADKERSNDTRFEQLAGLLRGDPAPIVQGTSAPVDQQKRPLWEQLPLRKTVRLGDSDYYLYAQAVPIDSRSPNGILPHGDAGRLKLIVAGLVPVSEVLWSALVIPHGVSLTLIFMSFALTFTLPLIKLATMGPRDRLGLTDALGCMLFSMMGTALLTFTIGSWTLHDQVKSAADVKLKVAAEAVRVNFKKELKSLVEKLKDLRKKPMSSLGGNCHKSKQYGVCFGMPIGVSLSDPLILTTIWIDPLGEIRHLETIRRTSLLTTNIRERGYVKDVWAGRLLHLESDHEMGFSIQPIYAWDDGEFGTMLATKVMPDEVPKARIRLGESVETKEYSAGEYVLAIRTRMQSLVNTVVPVGYGYAVIDTDGTVLYASDMSRNLRENLFSETDNDPRFTSLVRAQTTGTFRVNYRGRAHVVNVSRLLEPLSWTLVVYRDTRWLDWVTDQALFFGVALFTIYSFVILLGGLFVIVIFQSVNSGEGGWLWPAQQRFGIYEKLMVVNILFLLVIILVVYLCSEDHPVRVLLGAVVISCIAMGIMVWCLRTNPANKQVGLSEIRGERGALSPHTRWAYSGLATTAILLMSAMPSGVFLTVGFQRALSVYESYAANEFHMQIGKRKEESFRWHQHILGKDRFNDSPLAGIEYWQFLFNCDWTSTAQKSGTVNLTAQPPEWFMERTRSLLHLWMWAPGRQLGGWIGHSVDNMGGTSRFLLFAATGSLPWVFTGTALVGIAAILLYMRLCEEMRGKKKWVISLAIGVGIVGFAVLLWRSEDPGTSPTWQLAGFAFHLGIGCALLTATTYGCQRLVSHYLFLMDFAEPLIKSGYRQLVASKRVLLVLPPTHGAQWVEDKLIQDKWTVVNIAALLRDYEREGILNDSRIGKDIPTPLAILWFDHRLSERRQAINMLKLMEHLALENDRKILVISHRHPFDPEIVSFESSDIPVQDRSFVLSRDRWAAAFKDFTVIPYSGFEDFDDHLPMVETILREPAVLEPNNSQSSLWINWVHKTTTEGKGQSPDQQVESKARYALGVLRCRYEYWWADCTPSEKLALWHVVNDRFLHAGNSKLYPLLWKGLLKLSPDIKLRSKSFHLFVKQVGDRDELAFLRDDLKPSTWAKLSRPLLLGLLSAVIFLAVTQENVRDVIIALVPVLPAFLIEIPRLIGGNIRAAISREV